MFEPSTKEKAEVGAIRATALKDYVTQPMAENIVPPDAFYKYFLGFSDNDVEVIKTIQESAMRQGA